MENNAQNAAAENRDQVAPGNENSDSSVEEIAPFSLKNNKRLKGNRSSGGDSFHDLSIPNNGGNDANADPNPDRVLACPFREVSLDQEPCPSLFYSPEQMLAHLQTVHRLSVFPGPPICSRPFYGCRDCDNIFVEKTDYLSHCKHVHEMTITV